MSPNGIDSKGREVHGMEKRHAEDGPSTRESGLDKKHGHSVICDHHDDPDSMAEPK